MDKIVVLDPDDNVATSLGELPAGHVVTLPGDAGSLTLRDAIAFGHKFALRAIDTGVDIIKYGAVIGRASTAIEAGDWVHTHNVESVRGRGDKV